jgi:hypothetical protein
MPAGGVPANQVHLPMQLPVHKEATLATIEDFFPKKFASHTDLKGEDVLVTVNEVGEDFFQDDDGSVPASGGE